MSLDVDLQERGSVVGSRCDLVQAFGAHLVQFRVALGATSLVARRTSWLFLRRGWHSAPLLALPTWSDLYCIRVAGPFNLLEQGDHPRLQV